jgi:hypothetical protein
LENDRQELIRAKSIPVTWGILGWKTFFDEIWDVGHVLVLLTGNKLWIG